MKAEKSKELTSIPEIVQYQTECEVILDLTEPSSSYALSDSSQETDVGKAVGNPFILTMTKTFAKVTAFHLNMKRLVRP